MNLSPFSRQVRDAFAGGVASYEPQARLQRGVAWRLAGLTHHHGWRALPQGPCADLGAGTGLVGRALEGWHVPLPSPLQQLDLCPEALARNGTGPTQAWDLNQGLPPGLRGAALLTSSFALQWLDDPTGALTHWGEQLAPGGWLLLGVPTAGSFPEWRQAAERAGVPCSALVLPQAEHLRRGAASSGLEEIESRILTFSPQWPIGASPGALRSLRGIQAIGAGTSRCPEPLSAGAWRRLLASWPAGRPLSWEVLLLLARKPHPGDPACSAGRLPCSW